MSGYLIDTSILLAAERGERPGEAPDGAARLSVITLTELSVGVGRARGKKAREIREATLRHARSFIALTYDEYVAERLAEILIAARSRRTKVPIMDTIIAATALVHELVVWTLDDDFQALQKLAPELQIASGTP